jgi:hypothetical protein
MTTSISDAGIVFANNSIQPSAAQPQINALSASVSANALTIVQGQVSLAFRSTTLSSGAVTYVTGTPTNLVVPSSATLGTVGTVQSRLVVIALNNAGTIELAVVNITGGNDLTETGLISTTAISAAATSYSVVYSTTARTSVAYRVLGYVESTQATAGTWATSPSTVQGVGGQALTAMSSLGVGQTWQNVTGSRAYGTTYYNTTGKPIQVYAVGVNTGSAGGTGIQITVNGITMLNVCAQTNGAGNMNPSITTIVPPGGAYVIANAANTTLSQVCELR